MTGIDDLASEITNQADRLFPQRTDTSMFLKLYGEIAEMIESKGDADEVADVLIMVLDYGARRGIPLEAAIRKKMLVNEKRTWQINELGVASHVE